MLLQGGTPAFIRSDLGWLRGFLGTNRDDELMGGRRPLYEIRGFSRHSAQWRKINSSTTAISIKQQPANHECRFWILPNHPGDHKLSLERKECETTTENHFDGRIVAWSALYPNR